MLATFQLSPQWEQRLEQKDIKNRQFGEEQNKIKFNFTKKMSLKASLKRKLVSIESWGTENVPWGQNLIHQKLHLLKTVVHWKGEPKLRTHWGDSMLLKSSVYGMVLRGHHTQSDEIWFKEDCFHQKPAMELTNMVGMLVFGWLVWKIQDEGYYGILHCNSRVLLRPNYVCHGWSPFKESIVWRSESEAYVLIDSPVCWRC